MDGVLERLNYGSYFGENVIFNKESDENSKIVTTRASQFIVLPKFNFFKILSNFVYNIKNFYDNLKKIEKLY